MKGLRRYHLSSSSTSSPSSSSPKSSWIHLRSLFIVASSPIPDQGSLRSPWSGRKIKRPLTKQQWNNFFTEDGRLFDGGIRMLKKVRSGGIEASIRREVWPFLLGVFDLSSSASERNAARVEKRKEYEKLRRQCHRLLKLIDEGHKEVKEIGELNPPDSPTFIEGSDSLCNKDVSGAGESFAIDQKSSHDTLEQSVDEKTRVSSTNTKEGNSSEVTGANSDSAGFVEEHDSLCTKDISSAMESFSIEPKSQNDGVSEKPIPGATSASLINAEEDDKSGVTSIDASADDTESSGTESSIEEEPATSLMSSPAAGNPDSDASQSNRTTEDFTTWQRIIRLDAIRANAEWVNYSPAQAAVPEDRALQSALAVGLKDYDHLEPHRIYHAARLVAVLEAYALYDPEIGYCQGMSDLLSPILAFIEEDHEAFWCFVGIMRKARHNFRLDEMGIRRQLSIVSKIIKTKDAHLYKHLEKLQAEDCFFVYRMVVVMFRRELTFEQTMCLWEVMWADQAAVRAGLSKSAWARIRLRAPPTDDLLLYAIAASVLQRRKLIVEKYSSMEEILRECNSMSGHLDVWKLLDDAHDLVVSLHNKIE